MIIRRKINSVHLPHLRPKTGSDAVGCWIWNLERENVTSLYIFCQLDRRFSTKQKAKSFYAARATRGHQFSGVSKTPRGRDLFLLALIFD